MLRVLAFTLIPMATAVAGGLVAAFFEVGDRLRPVVQHLAAGVVFAAAAAELPPDIIARRAPLELAAGFVIGVSAMVGLRVITRRAAARRGGPSLGLLATTGADVLIDGCLIGITFAVGTREAALIVAALSLEMLFLGLAAATALAEPTRRRVVAATGGLALLLAVGAAAGSLVGRSVSGDLMELLLSVGLVVLLYLVTEELLVEAHEVKETPFATTSFFVGFLALLMLEMLVP